MSASPSGEEDGEVQVGIGEDGGTLPLIVRPRPGRDSAAFLQTWISAHTSWIDKKLLQHGQWLLYYNRYAEYMQKKIAEFAWYSQHEAYSD